MNFEQLATDAIRTFVLPKPTDTPLAIFFAGVPCSGKSTLTKELLRIFDLCFFTESQITKYLIPDKDFINREEDLLFGLVEKILAQLCSRKIGALFDANVFNYEWRQKLRAAIKEGGGVPIFIFVVTPENIKERVKKHNLSLNGNVHDGFMMDSERIHYEINRLQKPRTGEEVLIYDSSHGPLEIGRVVAGIKSRLLNSRNFHQTPEDQT